MMAVFDLPGAAWNDGDARRRARLGFGHGRKRERERARKNIGERERAASVVVLSPRGEQRRAGEGTAASWRGSSSSSLGRYR